MSRQNQKPTLTHFKFEKQVLSYLFNTKEKGLIFKKSNHEDLINVFVDADWAGESNRKSITGYLIYIGKNLVSYKTKKQLCVALSTFESETVAPCTAV